jgi:hypothetical protein
MLLNETVHRARIAAPVLVTSDGFEFCERVVRKVLGGAAIYGQVIKTRRNNRVIRVERNLTIGTQNQLNAALLESEDSATLNTSFVERMNLTLRQALAYLARRSPCHARCERRLNEDLALVRCHYNFVRIHAALKFGTTYKTPAMQAGLTDRRLSFHDIFGQRAPMHPCVVILRIPIRHLATGTLEPMVRLAA